jgi:hypothetical protein
LLKCLTQLVLINPNIRIINPTPGKDVFKYSDLLLQVDHSGVLGLDQSVNQVGDQGECVLHQQHVVGVEVGSEELPGYHL